MGRVGVHLTNNLLAANASTPKSTTANYLKNNRYTLKNLKTICFSTQSATKNANQAAAEGQRGRIETGLNRALLARRVK